MEDAESFKGLSLPVRKPRSADRVHPEVLVAHTFLHEGEMEQGEIVGQLEKRIAVFLVPCVELPHEVATDEFLKGLLERAAVGDARFLDQLFPGDSRLAGGECRNDFQMCGCIVEQGGIEMRRRPYTTTSCDSGRDMSQSRALSSSFLPIIKPSPNLWLPI